MKTTLINVLLFIIPFILVSTGIVAYFKITSTVSQIKIPTLPPITFSDLIKFSRFSLEKAPSESLVGTVSTMSGEINYEGRTATESAKITVAPSEVQQGESFATGSDGSIVIKFDNGADIELGSDTSVDIIQTLPKNLVFSQSSGTATYEKTGNYPVSIRSLHLLVDNDGKINISLDKIKPIITVKIESGSATFAYNNISNTSKIFTINAGKTLIFNDRTRRVVLK